MSIPDYTTLHGRAALILEAAMKKKVVTTDDALIDGELHGKRQGNPSLVGAGVQLCVRKGGLNPVPIPIDGLLASKRSDRRFRKKTGVLCFTKTETTSDLYDKLMKTLKKLPKRSRDLFTDLQD